MTITKDNIRDFAIQRVESKSVREQVVLALRSLGEKTIPVDDTVFTETKTVENDYFRWNGRSWETHGDCPNKTILKPSEFLKAIAHLLLSTNPRDYAIETIGDTIVRQQIIDALNAANEPMNISADKFPTSTNGYLFFIRGEWAIPGNPYIGPLTSVTPESFLKMHNAGKFVYEARPKSLTVLDQFLAGPIPTDNKFITYVHKNNLGEEILKAIEDGEGVNRTYPYASGKNIDFNLIFCWDRTPQGHTFWSRHHSKSGCSVDGGLLTKYLEAYKEARSGGMPKAVEEMSKSATYPPILVGAIYNYRTGTKYRVRHANSSKDSYTLETLSTGRTAPWCSDVTAAHIRSVSTLHTEAPSRAVKGTPITQAPEEVSSPVINGTSGIDPIIEKISMCTLSRVGTPIYFDEATSGIVTVHSAPRTIEIPTKGKPMPKTLKDNAVELVQENKAAAFTAAEIKAGQIINKQAISLIKPKLPMMVRGYADSPVASVVLANVVALGLKHYAAGNKKLEKISELMIAGAAFDSIDALNIDGIVNDFIAGLKLPAGVEIE